MISELQCPNDCLLWPRFEWLWPAHLKSSCIKALRAISSLLLSSGNVDPAWPNSHMWDWPIIWTRRSSRSKETNFEIQATTPLWCISKPPWLHSRLLSPVTCHPESCTFSSEIDLLVQVGQVWNKAIDSLFWLLILLNTLNKIYIFFSYSLTKLQFISH